jgi:hypothetical protein
MANEEYDFNRKDVGYCFKYVKKLIEALPAEIFKGDSDLAKKKKWADAGLVELDKFFYELKKIEKKDLNEYAGIKDKCKGLFDMVCGRNRPTVDFP